MKRFILSLLLATVVGGIVYGEEVQPLQEVPQQVSNDNRAVVSIQKQPTIKEQNQGVSRNWFCIILQWNGAVKYPAAENK